MVYPPTKCGSKESSTPTSRFLYLTSSWLMLNTNTDRLIIFLVLYPKAHPAVILHPHQSLLETLCTSTPINTRIMRVKGTYLVVWSEGKWCHLRKFAGNQLRNALYLVRHSECLLVPAETNLLPNMLQHCMHCAVDQVDSDDDDFASDELYTNPIRHNNTPIPPTPPPVPPEISTPIEVLENTTSVADLGWKSYFHSFEVSYFCLSKIRDG